MLIKTTISALLGLALVAEAASIHQAHPHRSPIGLVRRQNGKKGGNNNNNNNNNAQANAGGNANAASLTLLANAIQTGSQSTGQQNGVAADGQVNSKTDNANFINVCAGKTLTNGLQLKTGSCNGIPMGDIPATTNMVSTVITNPKNNDVITAQKTFDITVSVKGMQLGAFTNATSTYYSAPQALNGGGQIIGHTHVTVQNTGNTLQPTTPLDPVQFVFFKGINDAGDGNGNLKATVTGGLPAGNYRVCTITSAANHQPVVMPVAQRGAQEDCRYFTAGAATGNNNNNNNANTGANQGNNNAGKGGANAGTAGGAANQVEKGTTPEAQLLLGVLLRPEELPPEETTEQPLEPRLVLLRLLAESLHPPSPTAATRTAPSVSTATPS
ncbi:hypothetical protein B0T22DRAFT_108770 [Podospora appendiculata]|uniref:Ribosomal protein s17 n=1 Tax=Podospora appendiculata TaxID=314037 RepID=A0AAE0XL85_9PEZI|nr:hypothetical protein B0T22DRAFT_108770 [Podospora appendiculata]